MLIFRNGIQVNKMEKLTSDKHAVPTVTAGP